MVVLLIDVSEQAPYAVPADNPLVGRDGRDEIVAWGLRYPWRISFDGNTLFITDVGQDAFEEINVMNLDSLGRTSGGLRGR